MPATYTLPVSRAHLGWNIRYSNLCGIDQNFHAIFEQTPHSYIIGDKVSLNTAVIYWYNLYWLTSMFIGVYKTTCFDPFMIAQLKGSKHVVL
jgi:hypothetical protein